ncbi:MAG TPA: Spy/CpxP family protein refolding chaperone [Steroidobacteraceae bacterium]|nr:Spy/CpxP family protein refolding chaperone [Steroidobacteraceae bacterium]
MKRQTRGLGVARHWLNALVMVSAVSGPLVWAVPAAAAGAPQASPGSAAAPAPAPATTAPPKAKAPGIDGLIDHLHASFGITAAQEPLWQKVVGVMRENSEKLSKLSKARAEGSADRSAVEDLKSYAEISQAHADGTSKLIPAFQALYDSMSPEQKKAADAEFREHYSGHRHAH